MLAFLPAVAFGVTVEALPQSEYADTEVTTNIPFAVSFDTMSRVNFALSLDASPSNSVEVSIGEDANGDGNLSVEEAAYTFGFACGRWFKRDAAKDASAVLLKGGRLDLNGHPAPKKWAVDAADLPVTYAGELAFREGSELDVRGFTGDRSTTLLKATTISGALPTLKGLLFDGKSNHAGAG